MSTLDRQDFTPRPGAAPLLRQVLAQASMASAAEKASVGVPVLSSLRPGITRLAERVAQV